MLLFPHCLQRHPPSILHPVSTSYVPGPGLAARDLMVSKTDQDVVPDLMVWQSEWPDRRVNGQQYCGTGQGQRTLEHKVFWEDKEGTPSQAHKSWEEGQLLKGERSNKYGEEAGVKE